MSLKILPSVRWLQKTNLQQNYQHSIVITVVRGIAALEVAVHHLRNQFFVDYKLTAHPNLIFKSLVFITGFAHQAVMLFFVISGWLVGGSLLNKIESPSAIRNYALDRITRLWIVLIPTFALAIICAEFTTGVSASLSIHNTLSPLVFLGNLVGLQTLPFRGVDFPTYGGDYPLWSLANETWYYVLFPLALVSVRQGHTAIWVASAAVAIALMVFLPFSIVSYFSLWVLGVLFSRISLEGSGVFSYGSLVVFLLLSAYFRVTNNTDSLPIDLLYCAVFLTFLCSIQYPRSKGNYALIALVRVGDFFGNFSFSLYVTHALLIGVMAYLVLRFTGDHHLNPDRIRDWLIFLAMAIFVVAFARAFYAIFEARTHSLRNVLKRRLLPAVSAREI